MFKSKNLAHVLTCLESIEKIFIYAKPFNDHEENDQLNYNATFSLLMVIGKESKKIETNLKNAFPKIPWIQMSGLRNHLAHNYRGADPEVLFGIVRNHLPELKISLVKMISLIDFERSMLEKSLATEYYKNIRYFLQL